MQELFADRDFFDWLRHLSQAYGNAMSQWGQHVHDVAGGGANGAPERLIGATSAAIDELVEMLMAIGRRHDDTQLPNGADGVLDALDALLAESADLLRDAHTSLETNGLGALAGLSPRIARLRALEAEVERRSVAMGGRLTDIFGDPDGAQSAPGSETRGE